MDEQLKVKAPFQRSMGVKRTYTLRRSENVQTGG